MKKITAIITLMIILTGCTRVIPPTGYPIEVPTNLPPTKMILPTQTNSIQATHTLPPTSLPTVTKIPIPTATFMPSSTATQTEMPKVGLEVSRVDGSRMFKLYEFEFELKTDENGEEEYIGTISDKLAEVRLFGPAENINQAKLMVWVPQPPSENQSKRTMVYLATMLVVFVDEWDEGKDWLNKSMNIMGESRIQINNKEVVLILTPSDNLMTVELTIYGLSH